MGIRYLAGFMLTIIVLGLQMFVCGLPVNMSFISRLIDLPTILVVVIFPLAFQCILYGWKDFIFSFSVPFKKIVDKNIVVKAKTFFENYSRTVFSMAVIAFMFSVIATITVLEYKEALGPNMMIALIALLYAGIINMIIIIPYKIIIHKKIIE